MGWAAAGLTGAGALILRPHPDPLATHRGGSVRGAGGYGLGRSPPIGLLKYEQHREENENEKHFI